MPKKLPTPRHTVEKTASSVEVILPSKKNIFSVLFIFLWLLGWGFMLFFYAVVFGGIMFAFMPDLQINGGFIVIATFVLILLLALLALGLIGFYNFFWLIVGKEVFEANPRILSVSRQVFRWKRTQEYSANEVKDLRATTYQFGFSPNKTIQKLLGMNGVIAFDYGAKTFRFGLEIDEAEAKQIISAIKEGLQQQDKSSR
jgi:hypothetical protein